MGWALHKKCESARFFNQEILHWTRNWQQRGSKTGSKGTQPKRRVGVFKIRFRSDFPESFESVCCEHYQSREESEAQCYNQEKSVHHAVMFSDLNFVGTNQLQGVRT